eukprot:7308575-Pyramimonas_sp.AAC.1
MQTRPTGGRGARSPSPAAISLETSPRCIQEFCARLHASCNFGPDGRDPRFKTHYRAPGHALFCPACQ